MVCSSLNLSTARGLERKVDSAARAASAGREAILGDPYALQGKACAIEDLGLLPTHEESLFHGVLSLTQRCRFVMQRRPPNMP